MPAEPVVLAVGAAGYLAEALGEDLPGTEKTYVLKEPYIETQIRNPAKVGLFGYRWVDRSRGLIRVCGFGFGASGFGVEGVPRGNSWKSSEAQDGDSCPWGSTEACRTKAQKKNALQSHNTTEGNNN